MGLDRCCRCHNWRRIEKKNGFTSPPFPLPGIYPPIAAGKLESFVANRNVHLRDTFKEKSFLHFFLARHLIICQLQETNISLNEPCTLACSSVLSICGLLCLFPQLLCSITMHTQQKISHNNNESDDGDDFENRSLSLFDLDTDCSNLLSFCASNLKPREKTFVRTPDLSSPLLSSGIFLGASPEGGGRKCNDLPQEASQKIWAIFLGRGWILSWAKKSQYTITRNFFYAFSYGPF